MTQEEIDIMWQQAMQESIKDGEMFTRYHFAKLVAEKALAEHAMREVQRLGQEIEPDDIASILACRDMFDAQPVPPQRKPLTNGEIYTAYITATNQTLRATDERLAFAFARAIEAAHGIKEGA